MFYILTLIINLLQPLLLFTTLCFVLVALLFPLFIRLSNIWDGHGRICALEREVTLLRAEVTRLQVKVFRDKRGRKQGNRERDSSPLDALFSLATIIGMPCDDPECPIHGSMVFDPDGADEPLKL